MQINLPEQLKPCPKCLLPMFLHDEAGCPDPGGLTVTACRHGVRHGMECDDCGVETMERIPPAYERRIAMGFTLADMD